MTRLPIIAVALLAICGLTACKIVKTPATTGEDAAISEGEDGDDARNAARLAESFDTELLPFIRNTATDLPVLMAEIAKDIDAAGAKLGHRGAGQGAAWNFTVKGTGRVVAANLESRARKVELDTNADGAADVTLQLGPVIKGTALRDVAPFYDFNDFRDQIEFAKLGRAINDRVSSGLTLPQGDLLGNDLRFVGALALKSPDEALLVTVIELTQ